MERRSEEGRRSEDGGKDVRKGVERGEMNKRGDKRETNNTSPIIERIRIGT